MLKGLWKGLKSLRASAGECSDFQERRDTVRVDCDYSLEVRTGGSSYPAQVVDLSARGLRLHAGFSAEVGQSLELSYCSDTNPVQGTVAWCREGLTGDHILGLAFLKETIEGSWVSQILIDLGFSEESLFQRRKFVRADCDLTARFARADGTLILGRLLNLGARGALVDLTDSPEVEERVDFLVGPLDGLDGLSLGGRVRGVRPGEEGTMLCSVQFENLVDSEAQLLGAYLRHLLSGPEG